MNGAKTHLSSPPTGFRFYGSVRIRVEIRVRVRVRVRGPLLGDLDPSKNKSYIPLLQAPRQDPKWPHSYLSKESQI